MKKIYYLLLLTLLCFSNATGAVVCNQIVGGTNFQFKPESERNSFEDLQTFGNDRFYATKYTLNSGSITIPGKLNDNGEFVHTISGLPTNDTEYTIAVAYSSNGVTDFKFYAAYGSIVPIQGNYISETQKLTIRSYKGSISWSIRVLSRQQADIIIKSITVTGCIEPKIVSENGNILCKGEEYTFKAIGLGQNVIWKFNDIELENTNGSLYMGAFYEDGILSATGDGTTVTYEIKTISCYKNNSDREIVALETFEIPNSQNNTYELSHLSSRNRLFTAYQYAISKNAIEEDYYAIIKNTNGTWSNWYDNSYNIKAHIVYGNTQKNEDITEEILAKHNQQNSKNISYDGFMVVNCGRDTYPYSRSLILSYDIYNICPNTYYNLSSYISNIDAKDNEADINVLFEVVEIDAGGKENLLLHKETGYIPCGDQSWKKFEGYFTTGNASNVRVKLYNNNTVARLKDNNIIGNDVAIDDIMISRVIPQINVYFNEELTEISKEETKNSNEQKINLYVGHHDYIIADELMPSGYYIIEQRSINTDGTWGEWEKSIQSPLPLSNNEFEEVEVSIKPEQETTQYRAIVASTEEDIYTIMADNNAILSSCHIYNITKPKSYAELKLKSDITTSITENESKLVNISYLDNMIVISEINTETEISIINLIGQTIYKDTTINNQHKIDLSSFDPGIYLLKVGNKVEQIRKY